MEPQKLKSVLVRCTPELHEKLKETARLTGRTLNGLCVHLLQTYPNALRAMPPRQP